MSIAGARCLVTGGAGFIGSHIVDRLLAEGASEVSVFDNFSRGRRANLSQACQTGRVTVVDADLRKASAVTSATQGMDFVFHQASILLLEANENPRQALSVNVDGTLNVLLASAQSGVRKVVMASSASIFGEPSYVPVDEEHPLNNRTFYGATKIACEAMLTSVHHDHGLDFVALRYYNVYGPRQNPNGAYTQVLPRWMKALSEGQPLTINGDGSQTMDLTYVKEVARANVLAALSNSRNAFLNIGSGIETSVKELAKLFLRLRGGQSDVVFVKHDANLVKRRRSATEKARTLIGFEHAVSLTDGLQEYFEWFDTQRVEQPVSVG